MLLCLPVAVRGHQFDVAMETLACGVPTLISANTGHLDLLAMGFGHALPMGQSGSVEVDARVHRVYGRDRWVFGVKLILKKSSTGGWCR